MNSIEEGRQKEAEERTEEMMDKSFSKLTAGAFLKYGHLLAPRSLTTVSTAFIKIIGFWKLSKQIKY